jgi:hypothetical protein
MHPGSTGEPDLATYLPKIGMYIRSMAISDSTALQAAGRAVAELPACHHRSKADWQFYFFLSDHPLDSFPLES